jgi:RNA polymerase sigma-70 factor (subfamily 1)
LNPDPGGATEGAARRALEGDPDAFAELVRRIRGRLDVWIDIRMGPVLRSRMTVDDVRQETLLHAFRSLGAFEDRGPDSFRRWIFSVAENRLRDLHKFHTAQQRTPAREIRKTTSAEQDLLRKIDAETTAPSEAARRRESAQRLAAAIARLPSPLSDVVVHRAIECRSYDEIAISLDRQPSTVRGLFARALRELKAGLEDVA